MIKVLDEVSRQDTEAPAEVGGVAGVTKRKRNTLRKRSNAWRQLNASETSPLKLDQWKNALKVVLGRRRLALLG
jgi:hypothetical protein